MAKLLAIYEKEGPEKAFQSAGISDPTKLMKELNTKLKGTELGSVLNSAMDSMGPVGSINAQSPVVSGPTFSTTSTSKTRNMKFVHHDTN